MQGQAHLPKHRPKMGRISAAHLSMYEGISMDEKTIQAIEAILKRGNDVEIRRRGDGYIVLEVKKSIKYST